MVNIGNTWSASLQATGALVEFDDAALQAVGGKDRIVPAALAAAGAPASRRPPCRSTAWRTACTTTRSRSPTPASPHRRPPGSSSPSTARS
ncbi:hypothetical protein NKG94_11260 [Micromonospora sp. M12]